MTEDPLRAHEPASTRTSTRALRLLVALVATVGCEVEGEPEQWHTSGSREGEPLVLRDGALERRFLAFPCLEAPEEVEIDLRVGAWAETTVPAELTVSMTTPEGERAVAFDVEGRSRIDHEDLEPLLDPDLACEQGVLIVFRAAEPLDGAIEIEWALHFGFRSGAELVGTSVELVPVP